MRAAFFGTYNRGHTANRIAQAAVRAAGFDVVEYHEPLWEKTRDKHASYFAPASLARLALAWAGAAWRLARAWRRAGGAPVAVVGFNGQLDVLLLRLLCLRGGPRIVFAPLVSLTETLVEDRRVYREGSPAARLLRAIDRATCRAADVVVVDTEEHRRWFERELGIEPSRLLVCHLGADPAAFLDPPPPGNSPRETGPVPVSPTTPAPPSGADGRLEVLWFGQYLPLHGLDVIVDAVGRLATRGDLRSRLRFTFLGTGEERWRVERSLRATRADVHFQDWVPYEELAARIAAADVVLGIFGSSQKARMVVPNKVYEAAAVGAAIVTADTPAIREVFEDGREVVLCRADGLALADAIEALVAGPAGAARRAELGAAARGRMLEAFSAEALGRAWSVALAGPDALAMREPSAAPRVGVAVLAFQDARRALECAHSVAGDGWANLDVLVVDNGSVEAERRALEDGVAAGFASPVGGRRVDIEVLALPRNAGYAGANNVAMQRLFARGCEAVLLLNADTRLAPGSIAELVRAMRRHPGDGPFGPVVVDAFHGVATSRGERVVPALLWAPRSLLRPRRRRYAPYRVGGVTGCALLVPRALFERVGGFDESLFAYYEEVDLCLRARDAGFAPTVVPSAEVAHEGARGFASGMTPVAAFLKARNLRCVGAARTRGLARLVFDMGYHSLVLASSTLYRLRGRGDVAAAMLDGARAGMRGESGPPPAALFGASGYAASGLAGDSGGNGDEAAGVDGARAPVADRERADDAAGGSGTHAARDAASDAVPGDEERA